VNLRNIAIIAHVDHGKTTLVDGLLKQSNTFRENEQEMSQELIMDANDQERERGITILAKNTAVTYKGTKINIIDTPGHADFGGEVERTLNMADGALLVVDAQEGPMPQTKFVLKKALDLELKIIVVINKVDKKNAVIENTVSKIYDLFLELATHEDQLDFPIVYAWGKEGKAWKEMPAEPETSADFTPIFDAILDFIPAPKVTEGPFQVLVTSLGYDTYKGRYAVGRITRGQVIQGQRLALIKPSGETIIGTAENIFVNQGLDKIEIPTGETGDIVSIAGIKDACIGDTLADAQNPEALPAIRVAEPTLSITIGANTSPFRGTEGSILSSTKILERINREIQTNVAMKLHINEAGKYVVSGRGELHLSVFLETLRREGFEIEISKPTVMTKVVDGVEMEPIEELVIDVAADYLGTVKSELGQRRAMFLEQIETSANYTRLIFEIPTRNLLGLKGIMLSLTKGTAVSNSSFKRYEKMGTLLGQTRKGAIIVHSTGTTLTYGLVPAHAKGTVFVEPQTKVYEGMIVGINGRYEDIVINVCKGKQLTNNRSVGEDVIFIPPATTLSLEQMLGFIEQDELLEITPKSLRMRKKILNTEERKRAQRRS